MSENNISIQAINSVNQSKVAYCKFITANDAGVTGGHQSGFHLHKNSHTLFLDRPGIKGKNEEKFVKIKWHGDFITESRFTYYGVGTRDEYRLTRFGRDFPLLNEDSVGNLLILCKLEEDHYEGFVLSTDDEIEDFLTAFGLSPHETNRIINKDNNEAIDDVLNALFNKYIETLKVEFPATNEVAKNAREIMTRALKTPLSEISKNPDKVILQWLSAEYQLFKSIENNRYADILTRPFSDIEEFIQKANSVLNRRKSRAGKSLEHHLSYIFTNQGLRFTEQAVTEGSKRPDFIFPGQEEYRNIQFEGKKLIFLASKTTCKDRWRQILNEADRIEIKHLFTLQQGISVNQLKEMYSHNVKLIVPKEYLPAYPAEYKEKIGTLGSFIHYVKGTQTP